MSALIPNPICRLYVALIPMSLSLAFVMRYVLRILLSFPTQIQMCTTTHCDKLAVMGLILSIRYTPMKTGIFTRLISKHHSLFKHRYFHQIIIYLAYSTLVYARIAFLVSYRQLELSSNYCIISHPLNRVNTNHPMQDFHLLTQPPDAPPYQIIYNC